LFLEAECAYDCRTRATDYTLIPLPSNNNVNIIGTCLNEGYCASAFINSEKTKIILAFAGTDPGSLQDWLADAAFVHYNDVLKPYMMEAVNDFKALTLQYPNAEIEFTGHSLGGAIAQIMADATGLNATVFDSPGVKGLNFSDELAFLPNSSVSNPSQSITNYRIYGDLVSTAGTQLEKTETIIYKSDIDENLINNFPAMFMFANHHLSMLEQKIRTNATPTDDQGPTIESVIESISVPTLLHPIIGEINDLKDVYGQLFDIIGSVTFDKYFYIDRGSCKSLRRPIRMTGTKNLR
jgi:hypothetical protein